MSFTYDGIVKKVVVFFLALFCIATSYKLSAISYAPLARADEIDDLQKQIDQYNSLLGQISSANSTNKKQLAGLQSQMSSLQAKITTAKKQADDLSLSIAKQQSIFGLTYDRFSNRVAKLYVHKRQDWSLFFLLGSTDVGGIVRGIGYMERVRERDQQELTTLSNQIAQFEKDKANLEAMQSRLKTAQDSLDKNAKFLQGEIAKADSAQKEISGKIAALSARQQQILAERSGTATTSVGDVPLADDPASQPTYNPGFSPAFAVFSFGAPHFKGLSQYGAFGRAKSGQKAEDILKAYYGSGIEIKKDYATNIGIKVTGHGTVDIETYTKRIYEMPTSWGDQGGFEALKAQAVAARTYALAVTNNGASSICATESCQVYKPSNKGGKWDQAVDETRGWVVQTGGKPLVTYYASTAGGYIQGYTKNGYSTPGFWDTTSDWTRWADGAYEGKGKGNSPWFYKAWYKSRSGDSCGKSHPWLTEKEFADVLNAWQVLTNGGDASRVTPLGSCNGGNPFSMDEMTSQANGHGGAFTSVSSVSVQHGSNGYTKNVVVSTNKGTISIPGDQFKTAFNLRAPGRISVKGNLFGIEKK